jgi:hypothetical protein
MTVWIIKRLRVQALAGWLLVCILATMLYAERRVNAGLVVEAFSILTVAESNAAMLTVSNTTLAECNEYFDQYISHMRAEGEWLEVIAEATDVTK